MATPTARTCFPFLLGAATAIACTGTIAENGGPEPVAPRPGETPSPPASRPPGVSIIDDAPRAPGGEPACTTTAPPAPVPRAVRLTRRQYENTLRALTGLDLRPSREMPEDPAFAGFDRGVTLEAGDLLTRAYRDQAEKAAELMVTAPGAFERAVACDPRQGDACASSFIAAFGRRAFRRPLADDEKAAYLKLFKDAAALVDGTDAFRKGVRLVIEAMLQAPHLIYRIELATRREGGLVVLSPHELAARLSYMLTDDMPDPALAAAADAGTLAKPETLAMHAARLVDSAAGRETVRAFLGQWLAMEEYPGKLAKDDKAFPTMTAALAETLEQEEWRFFEEVTWKRARGLRSLLTAPFTFVNGSTAPMYGTTTRGEALVLVDLDPKQRAGLLTHVGFLASHAYALRSSPIHRGAFIQKRILCTEIPPPQAQVPALPPDTQGLTTREIVAKHTEPEGCRACHQIINPVGFGLENFGASGQWRTTDNGKAVDASGTLVGTQGAAKFDGPVGLVQAIAGTREARLCYGAHWLRYAYGRAEDEGDRCALEQIAQRLADDGYTTRELLVDLARTRAFLYRSPEGGTP